MLALLCVLLASSVIAFPQKDVTPGYDHPMGERFLDLAAATYLTADQESQRQQCFTKTSAEYEYQTQEVNTYTCDKNKGQCQMYVAYSKVKNNYVIAFRGTKGLNQLLTEAFASLKDYIPYMGENGVDYGAVNSYFYNTFNDVWKNIQPSISKNMNPQTTFYVTGHSLGGAMAAICAFRLSTNNITDPKNIKLITFGQPRTFDYVLASKYRDFVPNSFRVVHNLDPIPHAPALSNADRKGPSKPYHHPQEIWYDEEQSTQYLTCSASDGEDFACSDKEGTFHFVMDVLNNEHLHYFGHHLEKYGTGGCNSAVAVSVLGIFALAILRLL